MRLGGSSAGRQGVRTRAALGGRGTDSCAFLSLCRRGADRLQVAEGVPSEQAAEERAESPFELEGHAGRRRLLRARVEWKGARRRRRRRRLGLVSSPLPPFGRSPLLSQFRRPLPARPLARPPADRVSRRSASLRVRAVARARLPRRRQGREVESRAGRQQPSKGALARSPLSWADGRGLHPPARPPSPPALLPPPTRPDPTNPTPTPTSTPPSLHPRARRPFRNATDRRLPATATAAAVRPRRRRAHRRPLASRRGQRQRQRRRRRRR